MFVPAGEIVTDMHVDGSTKYANIFRDQEISIDVKLYDLKDKDPPIPEDFHYGPNGWLNRYSTLRSYFNVGEDKVIW